MITYITLFKTGQYSETLIIDQFERTEDLIIWESEDEYFSSRMAEMRPVDGGVFSYGLIAAVSAAPDRIIDNHIVSFLAPDYVHGLLATLHALVRTMRSAKWPEWEEQPHQTFVQWVCEQPADDNPRGDFIRDTRDLLESGIAEEEIERKMLSASTQSATEPHRLRRQFDRQFSSQFG